jgi:dephospho-CoA kinase
MSLKVVALTGSKGSGKDTVGQLITDAFGGQTIAFADPIKNVVEHIFQLPVQGVGLEDHQAYDQFKRTRMIFDLPKFNMMSIEARHVVREIGMLMREYDDKQFNKYVKEKIESDPNKIWVVTDLRFDNEYTMLKSIGAKVVKITRPAYTYDGHITEREFNDSLVDYTLMNDGSLDYLKIRTDIVMNQIMKEWQ